MSFPLSTASLQGRRPTALLPLGAVVLALTACAPVPQGRDFAPTGPSTLQPIPAAQAWWRRFPTRNWMR